MEIDRNKSQNEDVNSCVYVLIVRVLFVERLMGQGTVLANENLRRTVGVQL